VRGVRGRQPTPALEGRLIMRPTFTTVSGPICCSPGWERVKPRRRSARGPDALARVGAILELTTARHVPLFLHPGPAPGRDEPRGWRALTDHVAQIHAAWFTFASFGRREHPELAVSFAMLIGRAPLLSERSQARDGSPRAGCSPSPTTSSRPRSRRTPDQAGVSRAVVLRSGDGSAPVGRADQGVTVHPGKDSISRVHLRGRDRKPAQVV